MQMKMILFMKFYYDVNNSIHWAASELFWKRNDRKVNDFFSVLYLSVYYYFFRRLDCENKYTKRYVCIAYERENEIIHESIHISHHNMRCLTMTAKNSFVAFYITRK